MKSKEEKQFDALLAEYRKKFGKNYPLLITSTKTTQEHINDIQTAIQTNKKAPALSLKKDRTY